MRAEDLTGEPFKGFVNLAQLLGQPVGSSYSYDINEVIERKNRDFVQGYITVIRSGKGMIIRGEAVVEVELTCSRCLDLYFQPIRFRIEEEAIYLQGSSGDIQLFEEVDGYAIDDHNMLNLGELLRQYTLLNLPMKALCKPDCIGNKEVV
jgi:uncharacterized protein